MNQNQQGPLVSYKENRYIIFSDPGIGLSECVQINVFRCGICGCCTAIQPEAGIYYDPVITPPEGWGFTGDPSWEEDKLTCVTCMQTRGEDYGPTTY